MRQQKLKLSFYECVDRKGSGGKRACSLYRKHDKNVKTACNSLKKIDFIQQHEIMFGVKTPCKAKKSDISLVSSIDRYRYLLL